MCSLITNNILQYLFIYQQLRLTWRFEERRILFKELMNESQVFSHPPFIICFIIFISCLHYYVVNQENYLGQSTHGEVLTDISLSLLILHVLSQRNKLLGVILRNYLVFATAVKCKQISWLFINTTSKHMGVALPLKNSCFRP